MKKISFLVLSMFFITSCSNEVTTLQPALNNNTVQQQSKSSKLTNFKSDLWMAQSKARSWDLSSELVRAESRFINENGMGNWTFYFKSPFKQKLFKVDFGFGNEVPNMYFGREIREFDIRVDSDKAIELAKKQGLKKFPVSMMSLEKRSIYAEWEIRSSDGTFTINAESLK